VVHAAAVEVEAVVVVEAGVVVAAVMVVIVISHHLVVDVVVVVVVATTKRTVKVIKVDHVMVNQYLMPMMMTIIHEVVIVLRLVLVTPVDHVVVLAMLLVMIILPRNHPRVENLVAIKVINVNHHINIAVMAERRKNAERMMTDPKIVPQHLNRHFQFVELANPDVRITKF
jgi:hypothetical protein